MVFVLCIKETELQRDLILAQQVNREKSVIEKVIHKALVSKGLFRQSSEALKYKFNLLKKMPKSWHLEFLLTRAAPNTEVKVTMGKVKVIGNAEGKVYIK